MSPPTRNLPGTWRLRLTQCLPLGVPHSLPPPPLPGPNCTFLGLKSCQIRCFFLFPPLPPAALAILAYHLFQEALPDWVKNLLNAPRCPLL